MYCGERNSKIRDTRLAGLNQYVGRLQVPMNHAMRMCIVERVRNRYGDVYRFLDRSCLSRSSLALSGSPSTNGMT
jgi:hypothetical protein